MPKPLFYIEFDRVWRSMRPEVWREFVRENISSLRYRTEKPTFCEFGKLVVGKRPSRVKLQEMTKARRFWSPEPHIHVRSPANWSIGDWEFEMSQVRKFCKDPDREGHSIFRTLQRLKSAPVSP